MAKDPKSKSKPAVKVSRTEERQRERQAAQRRRTLIVGASVLVGVIALMAVVLLLSNQPVEALVPEGAAAAYADIPQGTAQNGYPRIGSLDGTVSVTLFTTFGCTGCKTFHDDIFPQLLGRVRANEISLTVLPMDVGSVINNGNGAARASICAQQQGIFWQYADALFDWMDVYGGQAFAFNRLVSGAENLGAVGGAFRSCMSSDLPNRVLDAVQRDAGGRQSTIVPPTVYVNNVPVEGGSDLVSINAAIDAALALRSGFVPTLEGTPAEAETPAATLEPTVEPTSEPTLVPTDEPTTEPTAEPATEVPTTEPTATTAP